VDVISTYEQVVRSPSFEMRLPSVVSLKHYVAQDRPPAFTRFNLFLRDAFSCQYCGSGSDLTFDHVRPRSRGGRTTWENIVTACAPCNLMKGGRTPAEAHMHPARSPARPTAYELQHLGRRFPPNHLHQSWLDYLYWDVELEA
jgi:5-methylcytosine-specific restriction endonuclease McrA